MKIKYLLVSLVALFTATSANAQDEDKNFLNHLSVGVNVGTPGYGIDVAVPLGNYFQIRGGIAILPDISVNTDLDVNMASVTGLDIPNSVEIEAKTGFTNGKVLVDIFPFKRSSFHITAGAYFGSSEIVKAYNKEDGLLQDIATYNAAYPNNKIGYELGDYLLTPDENGNINAKIKTASFKPYLGIGFGRAVPKKRIGFMFELGCQFWGSPKIYCNNDELTEEDFDGDGGDIVKTLSKISVYPVLNFRLCGRIF
ncbi:MAG: hypothetical protein Q4D41_05580 [Prevotellaceae bacterium]|nr:hypothetical protein [Prevotellaceae bacterium]